MADFAEIIFWGVFSAWVIFNAWLISNHRDRIASLEGSVFGHPQPVVAGQKTLNDFTSTEEE